MIGKTVNTLKIAQKNQLKKSRPLTIINKIRITVATFRRPIRYPTGLKDDFFLHLIRL